MKCFRHDAGKLCPECGLDRRNKMKLKVQAQYLQPGDIVGSGEVVSGIVYSSTKFPSSKIQVWLDSRDKLTDQLKTRSTYWGKYTDINIQRPENKK